MEYSSDFMVHLVGSSICFLYFEINLLVLETEFAATDQNIIN